MSIISLLMDNKLKIAYILTYSIAVIIGVIAIHESGHFLGALVIGVPINEIDVGLIGIYPGVTIPARFIHTPLGIYYYAGGFSAAIICSVVYYYIWYRKYRDTQSIITWYYGAFTIAAAGAQFGQGYMEGRFHVAYISYAGSPFHVTQIITYLWVALAIFIHFLLFQLARKKKWLAEFEEYILDIKVPFFVLTIVHI